MGEVGVAADAQGAHEGAVPEIFQPAFGAQSVFACGFHAFLAGCEGGVGEALGLEGDLAQGLGAAAHGELAFHAVYLGAEVLSVRRHFQGDGRRERVDEAQVAPRGHHCIEGGRDVAHGQGMRVHAGDGKVGKQRAVIERARHLAHSAAHTFHESAVVYDESRLIAALLRARSHRVVEGEFLFGREQDAVYGGGCEGDVMFAVFGAVAVIGGELGDEGDLGRFGVRGGERQGHTA